MDFTRIFDIVGYHLRRHPDEGGLFELDAQHSWQKTSMPAFADTIIKYRVFLLQKGLAKGDRVGLLFHHTTARLLAMDLAAMSEGITPVMIHHQTPENDLRFICTDAQLKSLFYIYENDGMSALSIPCIAIPDPDTLAGYSEMPLFDAEILPGDLATIVYTSGSSGLPKGVMLTHQNIVSNLKSIVASVPIKAGQRALSFLPLAHIFERVVVWSYLIYSCRIYFLPDPKEVLVHIKTIRPHYFTAVPRLLERFYETILARRKAERGLNKWLLNLALRVGETYGPDQRKKLGYYYKKFIIHFLVYRVWRQMLGGEVKGIIVGGSALRAGIARLFSAAGIPVREGYGMTETSPVISINRFSPGQYRFGTAGMALPGVEVRITQANENGVGEIQVKGPNVMLGYTNPVLNTEVFTEDGWLKTGDLGQWIDGKFLAITDRASQVFKTSSGKFVYPVRITNLVERDPLVEFCCIEGFQKPYVVAIIKPDFVRLEEWCGHHDIHWTAPLYMVHNIKVVQHYQGIIDEANLQLASHEIIRKFILVADEWSIQNGDLSAIQKPRRQAILEKYQSELKKLYQL